MQYCPITLKKTADIDVRYKDYDAEALLRWVETCLDKNLPPTFPHNREPVSHLVIEELYLITGKRKRSIKLTRVEDPLVYQGLIIYNNRADGGDEIWVNCLKRKGVYGVAFWVLPGYAIDKYMSPSINPLEDKFLYVNTIHCSCLRNQ